MFTPSKVVSAPVAVPVEIAIDCSRDADAPAEDLPCADECVAGNADELMWI